MASPGAGLWPRTPGHGGLSINLLSAPSGWTASTTGRATEHIGDIIEITQG